MGLNPNNSNADPICPTYAAGTLSLWTNRQGSGFNNDAACPGQPNGYINTQVSLTVGSFNSDWTNSYLTQSKQPVYRNGLLSFGNTGLQS